MKLVKEITFCSDPQEIRNGIYYRKCYHKIEPIILDLSYIQSIKIRTLRDYLLTTTYKGFFKTKYTIIKDETIKEHKCLEVNVMYGLRGYEYRIYLTLDSLNDMPLVRKLLKENK